MKLWMIFVVIALIGFLFMGYMHEAVHQIIYEHYGIKSKIYFFKCFPDWCTIVEGVCPNDTCIEMNVINEIVGYPLMVFYFLLIVGITYFLMLKEIEIDILKSKIQVRHLNSKF